MSWKCAWVERTAHRVSSARQDTVRLALREWSSRGAIAYAYRKPLGSRQESRALATNSRTHVVILQGANTMSTVTLPLPQLLVRLYARAAQQIDRLQPLASLALRVYVARVFFLSGLTKIHDWNVTLALFE